MQKEIAKNSDKQHNKTNTPTTTPTSDFIIMLTSKTANPRQQSTRFRNQNTPQFKAIHSPLEEVLILIRKTNTTSRMRQIHEQTKTQSQHRILKRRENDQRRTD